MPVSGSHPVTYQRQPVCKVGRRRVTPVARSTFPSAPFRTGRAAFTASGSPVVYVCDCGLIPRSRMTFSTVSAFLILSTSLSCFV